MRPVTCVGVDITWWGGGSSRASRRETIVAIRLDSHPSIAVEMIDLSSVPNPRSSEPGEPNFDREGSRLVDGLVQAISRVAGDGDRVIVALDAPLEAMSRPGQPPRVKAVAKGEKMGSRRRECEDALSRYSASLPKDTARGWSKDLKIQSGSPIAPRIASVLRLLQAHGYEIVRSSTQNPDKGIIEIFPSQAIWALGILGHYAATSKDVRAYKSKTDKVMKSDDAFQIAQRPLLGFCELLSQQGVLEPDLVREWMTTIAQNAVDCSPGRELGLVHKGKGFDDPIDSGIAALTCVAYSLGLFHIFGDGTDGTIIGPGKL